MLVDSSVWIDFVRGTDTPEARRLVSTLRAGDGIWIAPPILQEVLQGADTPQRFTTWQRSLGELPLLAHPDQRVLARDAAKLYARCRWAGITPRSANDCLIAQYAINAGIPLLHRDQDFPAIARVEPRLKLVPGTP